MSDVTTVTQNYAILRRLDHDLFFQRRQLEFALEGQHFEARVSLHERAELQETMKTKDRQKKFDALIRRFARKESSTLTHNSCWVINLSFKTIFQDQEQVLSKGLNYAPSLHRVAISETVSAVETALSKVTCPVSKSEARIKVSSLLSRPNLPTMNLTTGQAKALDELRHDRDLVILPADKGRSTILMDRVDYDST